MSKPWTTDDIPSQQGKTFLITGASSGVGLAATKALVKKGGRVVMAVRNMAKGEAVRQAVRTEMPQAQLELRELNLSDLDSVRAFTASFNEQHRQLDVLINNAGLISPNLREETKQGFESHFGTNHLGHFVLTAGLWDVLRGTENARVVTVASMNPQYYQAHIHWNDLQYQHQYSGMVAYTQSKLANFMFALELDSRLQQNHSLVKSLVANPGYVRSGMQNDMSLLTKLTSLLLAQSPEMGMLPELRAAVDPDVQGGEYYSPQRMQQMRGYPEQTIPPQPALDPVQRQRLWALSEELTQTKFSINSL